MPAHWLTTKQLPLADLARYPGNPRRGDTGQIRASIRRHGQYRAIVVRHHDGQHTILAGNHTADALAQLAAQHPTIDDLLKIHPENRRAEYEHTARTLLAQLTAGTARCEIIECSDDEAARINLADNRLAELGDYDDQALAAMLASLDGDYDGTGWEEDDLSGILAEAGGYNPDAIPGHGQGDDGSNDDGDGSDDAPARGELLALAGVTAGEPRHKPERGQVWSLGPHKLVIADVFTGWPLWSPLLTGEATFLPYPTPLAPHAPGYGPLVMVQPELFLAGCLLDKWENITGQPPELVPGEG